MGSLDTAWRRLARIYEPHINNTMGAHKRSRSANIEVQSLQKWNISRLFGSPKVTVIMIISESTVTNVYLMILHTPAQRVFSNFVFVHFFRIFCLLAFYTLQARSIDYYRCLTRLCGWCLHCCSRQRVAQRKSFLTCYSLYPCDCEICNFN